MSMCATLEDCLRSKGSRYEIVHHPYSHSSMEAAAAAHRGAQSTARLIARRGRASYLGERVLGHPDPGAAAAAIWLRAAVQSLSA